MITVYLLTTNATLLKIGRKTLDVKSKSCIYKWVVLVFKLVMYDIRVQLNVIGNVLHNPAFTNRIKSHQAQVIDQHKAKFKTLLDKRIALDRKRALLLKHGHLFMPTLLEIIGDHIKTLLPQHRNKRNCPLCEKKDLVKLSNHLKQVHNLTGRERILVLRHGFRRSDGTRN